MVDSDDFGMIVFRSALQVNDTNKRRAGGFGVTTPVASRKGQLGNSVVAGPSRSSINHKRKAGGHVFVGSEDGGVEESKLGKNNRRKGATERRRRKEAEDEEVEEVEAENEERKRWSRRGEVEVDKDESEGEDEVQEIAPPPKKARGGSTSRSGSVRKLTTNGNTRGTPAIKGKGRAKPSSSIVKRKDDTMDMDEVEVMEVDEEDVHAEVDKVFHAALREKHALQLEKLENEEISRLREHLQQVRLAFSNVVKSKFGVGDRPKNISTT